MNNITTKTRSARFQQVIKKSHNVHIHTETLSRTLAATHYTASYNTTHFGWLAGLRWISDTLGLDDIICRAAKGSLE